MYVTEPPKTNATPPHVKSGSGAPLKICVDTTVEILSTHPNGQTAAVRRQTGTHARAHTHTQGAGGGSSD